MRFGNGALALVAVTLLSACAGYALLGISYRLNGDNAAARRWLKRAVGVAAVASDRQRYQNKLDLLAGHSRN